MMDNTNKIQSKNLFIEAGPGTGKTTKLIEFILDDIEQGIPIREIVCISFTNKAANELRAKLLEKLLLIVNGGVVDKVKVEKNKRLNLKSEEYEDVSKENREKYKKALSDIYFMNISTIHSFCSNIIKERALNTDFGLDYSQDTDANGDSKTIFLKSMFIDYYGKLAPKNPLVSQYDLFNYFEDGISKILKYNDFDFIENTDKLKEIEKATGVDISETVIDEYFLNKFRNYYLELEAEMKNKIASLKEKYRNLTVFQNNKHTYNFIDKENIVFKKYFDAVEKRVFKYTESNEIKKIDTTNGFNKSYPNIKDINDLIKSSLLLKSDLTQNLAKEIHIDIREKYQKVIDKANATLKVERSKANKNIDDFIIAYENSKQEIINALTEVAEDLKRKETYKVKNVIAYFSENKEEVIDEYIQNIRSEVFQNIEGKKVEEIYNEKTVVFKKVTQADNYKTILQETLFVFKNCTDESIGDINKKFHSLYIDLLNDLNKELAENSIQLKLEITNIKQLHKQNTYLEIYNDFYFNYLKKHNINSSILNNDDLIIEAKKIVQNSRESREYLQGKYRKIYVDEFQDTDLTQLELFFMLNAVDEDVIDDKYIKLDYKIRDNSLVLVGDPKQSIYSFRDSDIRMYELAKNYFDRNENCKFEILDKTFRYKSDIAKSLHYIFKDNNDNGIDLGAPNKLLRSGKPSEEALSGMYFGDYKCEDDLLSIEIKKVDLDKNNIIDTEPTIEDLCSKKKQLVTYELLPKLIKELTKYKVSSDKFIGYGDIMILADFKKSSVIIGEELKKHNIPANISGVEAEIEDFADFKLISVIKNLLRLCAKSNDRFALFSILILLYGYTMDECLELEKMTSENGFKFTTVYDLDKLEFKKIKYYLEQRKYAQNPLALLEEIINDIDIINSKHLGCPTLEEFSIINKALEALRAEKIASYSHLYRLFSAATSKTYEEDFQFIENAKEVRVMNLHKAKGLQAEIVIYVREEPKEIEESSYTEISAFDSSLDCNIKNFYPVLTSKGSFRSAPLTHGIDEISEKTIENAKKEEDRKLFVAMTRARNAMIVFDPVTNKFDFIKEKLSENPLMTLFEEDGDKKEGQEANTVSYFDMLSLRESLKEIEAKKKVVESITPSKIKPKKIDPFQEVKIEPLNSQENISDYLESEHLELDVKSKLYGPQYGNLIHKTFEILVKNHSNSKHKEGSGLELAFKEALMTCLELEEIGKTFIEKVLEEVADSNLEKFNKETLESKTNILYQALNTKVLKVLKTLYDSKLEEILKTGSEFYPELFFDVKLKDPHFSQKSVENINLDQEYRVSGYFDLVVKYSDDKYVIYDYKTDKNLENLSTSQLESQLYKKGYTDQLIAYKKVLETVLGNKESLDISYEILLVPEL